MKSIDRAIAIILIGGVFPLLFLILALVLWFTIDKNVENVWFYLIPGLITGVLIDVKYLTNWIERRYRLRLWFVSGIYIFHSICIYVMLMGVPVLNLFLGLIAGYYYAKKIQYLNIPYEHQNRIKTNVSLFTALTMALLCTTSGIVAISYDSTGENLRNLFRLNFEVTKAMILGIALAGGITLIGIQYFLTRLTMNIMIKNIDVSDNTRR